MAVQPKLQLIPQSLLDPHPQNPNEMDELRFKKLRNNIARTGRYPALIVRPNGKRFQIIDGYHRWLVLTDLKHPDIKCEVWDIDQKETKLLLTTLNRLRGTDDTKKRAQLLNDLAIEFGDNSFTQLVPETERALTGLLKVIENDQAEVDIEVEQGMIEEKLMQAGVDAEQATQMANLHQKPGTKGVVKFVFDSEEDYNKAVEFYGKKGDPAKLIYIINQYEQQGEEVRLDQAED